MQYYSRRRASNSSPPKQQVVIDGEFLNKMLKRIIADNGNFVSKEQAEEGLKELSKLRNQNNIYRAIVSDTKKLAQAGLKALAPLYNDKSNT